VELLEAALEDAGLAVLVRDEVDALEAVFESDELGVVEAVELVEVAELGELAAVELALAGVPLVLVVVLDGVATESA
jgi:hypothetical protein